MELAARGRPIGSAKYTNRNSTVGATVEPETILQLIQAFFSKTPFAGETRHPITSDTDLFETGYLDSLNTVALIMFLEEKLGVELTPSSLNLEDLRSVTQLHSALRLAAEESKIL